MPPEKDIKDCKRVIKSKFRRNIFKSYKKNIDPTSKINKYV